MAQKKPALTLLGQAETKEAVVPVVDQSGPRPPEETSKYRELFASLPGDPDMKNFLLSQIETSRGWGDTMLPVSSAFLIALLDKCVWAQYRADEARHD